MPLPLLLVGAAVAAAGWGVKKGIDAKSDFDAAESINEDAQEIFDKAKRSLEECREETQSRLESLGRQKALLFEEALIPFVETFSRIKNVDFKDMDIPDDNIQITSGEILEIRDAAIRMEKVVGGAAGALGSGALAGLAAYGSVGLASASTGTAIAGLSGAAATNATLAWLGGGSLAAGGLGIAGGTAVLGGIVAAPVLLVGGLMLASKAEEAKENALSNLWGAKAAAEAMETAEVAARAIGRKADEVGKVLKRLREDHLAGDIKEFQNLVYNRSKNKLVYRTVSLALKVFDSLTLSLRNFHNLTSKINGGSFSDISKYQFVNRAASLTVTALGITASLTIRVLEIMTSLAKKSLEIIISKSSDYRTYSKPEKELVDRTVSLAITAKNLIEAPLLEEDGSITRAIRKELNKAGEFLSKIDAM